MSADYDIERSFDANLSFANYEHNYDVPNPLDEKTSKSALFRQKMGHSSQLGHRQALQTEASNLHVSSAPRISKHKRRPLDPLKIPVALDQKDIREKSLAKNLRNIQFDSVEMEDLCSEPDFLGSYFKATRKLAK